jgi:hypothetical protein
MPRDQYTFGHTSEFRREDNGQGTVQKHTVQVRGTVTMAELIAELTNQGAPDEVYVSHATIHWEAEASLDVAGAARGACCARRSSGRRCGSARPSSA